MAGLILAGLGRGIADAATTYGNFKMKESDDQRRREEEALREERLIEREERLIEREDRRAAAKEQQEIDKAERLQQRVATDTARVNQIATEAPIQRDAGLIGSLAGKVAGDSPAMGQDEIAALIKENPEYRDIYRQAGYITDKTDPRMQRVEDEAAAALQIGAYSTVVDAISKKRESVLALIREENKDAREQNRNDITFARDERRFEIQERNADTAARRVEALAARGTSGGRSADPAKNEIARAREDRLSLKDERADIIRRRETGLMDKKTAVNRLAEIDARDKRLAKKIEDGEESALAAKTAPAPAKGGDNKAPASRPPLTSFMKN